MRDSTRRVRLKVDLEPCQGHAVCQLEALEAAVRHGPNRVLAIEA